MPVDKFHRRCCYNCTHHRDFHLSGETVIGVYNGYPKEEVEFLYRDTLKEVYICKPTGDAKYKFPRSYKKVLPATEENLSRLYNR